MKSVKICMLWITALMLSACVTMGGGSAGGGMPTPARSEYFRSEGAGFMMRTGVGYVQYALSLRLLKPLPSGAILAAEFENPSDSSAPLKSDVAVKPGEELIHVGSPQITAIQNKRNYRATVFVKSIDGKVIGEHTQYVRFDIPPGMEGMLGIKLINP